MDRNILEPREMHNAQPSGTTHFMMFAHSFVTEDDTTTGRPRLPECSLSHACLANDTTVYGPLFCHCVLGQLQAGDECVATMVMHAGNVCSYLIAVERDNGAKKLLLHQNEVREVEIYLIRTFTFHTPDEDDAPMTTMKAPARGKWVGSVCTAQ